MATMLKVQRMGEGDEDPKMIAAKSGKSKAEELIDIRDSISNLIAGGAQNLSRPESRAHYDSLVQKIGVPAAQKLITKIALYNQDAGKRNMPLEEKVSMFYDTPGDDVEISELLRNVKGLGYGIKEGVRTSHDYGVAETLGDKGAFARTPVMLRVSK